MTRPHASYLRLLIRVAVYALVIIVLFRLRDRVEFKRLVRQLTAPSAADTSLVLSGSDAAPALINRMVANYHREYPKLALRVGGGQTTAALEELVNKRASVAFLSRPPLPSEQRLFVQAGGDSALWFPIALGAILVLVGQASADTSESLVTLRALADGTPAAGRDKLYVPDPNSGLWDAFRAKLGLRPALDAAPSGVVFLKDDAAVADAVGADATSLGVISSFTMPDGPAPHGARAVSLRAAPGAQAFRPDVEQIASGDYPLWSYVYISCLSRGGAQGAKFVTYMTSTRGQRQIEDTDYLPVQQVMRPVYLNRSPGPASPPGPEEGTG